VAGESKKTVLVAVGANATIAVVKGIAGGFSGSASLLAEAAHSVADTSNQLMLLVSISLGAREPDEEHPFGYGKERFFWTLLAAVLIFLAGAVFSIGQGVLEVVRGGGEKDYWLALGTILFAGAAEGTSFARALRQTRAESRRAHVPLVKYIRESKDPTVKAVISEDATDLVGLLFALVGVTAAHVAGNSVYDGVGAILVGSLLVVVAGVLGRDTKGLLIGEAAPARERNALRRAIEQHVEVKSVCDLRTMYIGPEALLVAARVDLVDGIDARQIEALADEIERELKRAVPTVGEVFLDPTGSKRSFSG
jgi:cation diffusion facilitator family transporter